jgi:TP901 family phage tail tape measure protein
MIATTVKYDITGNLLDKLDAMEKKLAHFDAMIDKSDKQVSKFGKGAKGGGGFLDKLLPKNGGMMDKLTTSLSAIPGLNSGILSSAGSLANPYIAAGAAAVALGAVAMDGTRMAMDWDRSMAKANVTMQATPAKLKEVGDQLKHMERYGTNINELPESFNKIISGIGDTSKALDIMEVSLKSSRANFGQLDIAADAIVNVMGSAGSQFKNATEVSDLLTASMIQGKAEFNDMANYLPRIIPYANNLGFSVRETAGAFALLTAKGQSSEQVAMLLQNTFTALADKKKRSNLKQFVDIFDHGKLKPFAQVFDEIGNKMKGLNPEQMAKFMSVLDLDAQSSSAFKQLVDNTALLKTNITALENSKGATDKALGDGKNGYDVIDKLRTKWEDMKMKIGEQIAPGIIKLLEGLEHAWEWLEKTEQSTGIFSSTWEVLKGLLEISLAPIMRIWNGLKFIFGGLGDVDGASKGNYFSKFIQFAVAGLSDLLFVAGKTFQILGDIASLDWSATKEDFKSFGTHDYAVNGHDAPAPAPYVDYVHKLPPPNVDMFGNKFLFQPLGPTIPTSPTTPVADPKADQSVLDILAAADTKDKKKKEKKEAKSIHEVAGGGNQVRNVVVNIGKQIETVRIETTNMAGQSVSQIKKILEDLLVTAVRDSELALGH